MLAKNNKLPFLVLFFAGLISVFIFRLRQVKKTKTMPFSPQKSSFVSKPPADTLKGKIIEASGKVEKEPREKDEFEEVGVKEAVLQGEKLATGEKSYATVEFPDFAKIDLGSETELGFINLIPSSFLINQTRGEASYQLLQDKEPLSLRSLHVLLTFSSGESQVVAEVGEITVKILSGKAKLALVDLENKTHVWQLEKGQEVLIDDVERSVAVGEL